MNKPEQENVDVLVIGAGPSGSLSSALLSQGGVSVLVVEKQSFPRFSIGESLLPQLMVFLSRADMVTTVEAGNYQVKNGASFSRRGQFSQFDFRKKFSAGPGTTFQVKRADFDKRLIDAAQARGVPVRYQHEVVSIDIKDDHCQVVIRDDSGKDYMVKAGFVLDASGFGRVLPRLLDLEYPSNFPVRKSIFCHIKDNIGDSNFDRNKILVSVHPENERVWYWLIPFSDGTSSFGVVGAPAFFDQLEGNLQQKIVSCRDAEPGLAVLLKDAEIITDVRELTGFAANVKSLHGANYALLGNAGEFLDPVFSSGVTIALKSADLASALLIRQKNGEAVCWEKEYATPLKKGVDVFRVFVDAWYDGSLQDIIFYSDSNPEVKEMVCSILAGYAWDESNPFVQKPGRRIKALAEICKSVS